MAKGDFYFPLYYKRILTSTIGWKDDEFGAYMRLLIYQFDNGSIPSDINELARIAPSVKKHWDKLLSKKFKEDGKGGLINDVMNDVYMDVQKKKEKNQENGKKGGRRKPNGNPTVSERLTEGVTQIEAIPISNIKEQITKEIETPVFNPELLVPQMHQLFKEQNPNGFFDPKEDFAPLREIAEKIKRWLNLEGEFLQHARPILDNWRYILTHVKADKHLAKYSLSQVNKYFSSIVQSYNQSGNVPVKQDTVKKDYSDTKKILEEVYGKVED